MRRILIYLSSAILLTGCTTAETDVPAEEKPGTLAIRGLALPPGTKAIYEGTEAEGTAANHLGAIGVLVTRGGREYYSPVVTTQTFTYGSPAWTSATVLNLDNTDGTVYAWAPADATGVLDGGSSPKVPVVSAPQIPAAQSFGYGNEWETTQTDYLYGTAADETAPVVNRLSPVVTLSMRHVLAKISFRIMKSEGQEITTEDFVKRIELTSATSAFRIATPPATDAILRLTDGVLMGTTAAAILTLAAMTDAEKQGPIAVWAAVEGVPDFSAIALPQAYGLVAPVQVGAMGVKLTLGQAGALNPEADHTYQTAVGEPAVSEVAWLPGKHYAYTLTLTDRGILMNRVQVIDWDETPPPVYIPVE